MIVASIALLSIVQLVSAQAVYTSCPPATTVPMAYNGDAECIDGRIRLTEEAPEQAGTAFTATSFSDLTVVDDTECVAFESYLEYEIIDTVSDSGHADGLAFVIHRDPRGLFAISDAPGGGLGIYNGETNSGPGGIARALIVEIDTYPNIGPMAPFSPTIGPMTPFSTTSYARAIDVIVTDGEGYATRLHEEDITVTDVWSDRGKLWISYGVSGPGILDIYFGGEFTDPRPEFPLISVEVDIPYMCDSDEEEVEAGGGENKLNHVYCGIAASTGGQYDRHEIIEFSGCNGVGLDD